MYETQNRNARNPIKISILASLELVSHYIKALIESDRTLKVVDIAESHSKLIEMASKNPPDVILLCLMEDEGRQIGFIADLVKLVPDVRIVVLTSPNSNLDQPASLKLGVRGIVGANQNTRVLTRAIQQVFEGDLWLNQKLVDQLLGAPDSQNGNGTRRGTRVHDLTPREIEIIELVGNGSNNKGIAKQLIISEATVRHHLSSIYSKLHIEDRLNLAIFAYQNGIVKAESSVGKTNGAAHVGNGANSVK